MPEMTSYAPGTPCWADVSSDDPAAAAAFYSALFGWEAMEMPDSGGYTMFFQDGKTVGAAGRNQSGDSAMWSTYIATDDADATAAKIVEAGGAVIVEPMDVMDAGRMVFATDPQGVVFGVWQPGNHTGAQLVNEPCAYTWAELNTTDIDAAQAFYSTVFGWEPEEMPGGDDFHYVMQKVEGRVVGGMMAIGEMPPCWGVYIAVEDADAAIAKAGELGGSTLRPATDTPYGRMALLSDPDGAVFSVIQMPAEASGA